MPSRSTHCLSAALAMSCLMAACATTISTGAPTKPAPSLPTIAKQLQLHRPSPAPASQSAPLLALLESDVQRAMAELTVRADPPPHHLAYEATELHAFILRAADGALVESKQVRRRLLDVDVRVGTPALDDTHPRLEARYFLGSAELPLEDEPGALRNALWLHTDAAYKAARADLTKVQSELRVGIASDSDVADFSPQRPSRFIQSPARVVLDGPRWEERIKTLSAIFRDRPHIEQSFVRLEVSGATRAFATSDGSALQTARVHARIAVGAAATAGDGSALTRGDEFDAHTVEGLPAQDVIAARMRQLADELDSLVRAPVAAPYTGPAILEGRAAAVFFHEIFGHRVEGHRQKGDAEGQTFADRVGQPVMDDIFDVYDDPTIASVNGRDLNGHYLFDSEGAPAARAQLIEDGIFRGFLMSRSPIRGFDQSNGHGRRQPGYRAVARQGALVVDPEWVTSREALNAALLAEVRRQKKPYGLRIGEVTGGYTTTQRGDPQAFVVRPVMVYKIHADGREELVRGVNLEGTPLTVLAGVIAAANDFQVFNGYCEAESGQVPVSAVSPSLLLRQIELSREETAGQLPPILPPPVFEVAR